MTARGLRQKQLAELVSEMSGTPLSQVSIQKLTSGKSQRSKRLTDIALALNVPAEWLSNGPSQFFESGTNLFLDASKMDFASNTDMDERNLKRGMVPVIGTAKLGPDGYFAEEEYPADKDPGCLRIYSADPDAYGLRIQGDSMSPRIKHGEFVVIEPNMPPVKYEEVLVVATDGRKMIKVYADLNDGFYRFDSINEDHRPIHMACSEVKGIYYVAGILKKARYFET